MKEKKGRSGPPVASNEEWIVQAQKPKRRCCVCRDASNEYLQDLLRQINKAKAHAISIQAIYDRMCEMKRGFGDRCGFHSFRMHLTHHEPLWHRSKVK
jgi:hypothetical protein